MTEHGSHTEWLTCTAVTVKGEGEKRRSGRAAIQCKSYRVVVECSRRAVTQSSDTEQSYRPVTQRDHTERSYRPVTQSSHTEQ